MTWALKLNAYALKYVFLQAIKGQTLADFLSRYPWVEIIDPLIEAHNYIGMRSWQLTFDGLRTKNGVGVGVTITNPLEKKGRFIFEVDSSFSNN